MKFYQFNITENTSAGDYYAELPTYETISYIFDSNEKALNYAKYYIISSINAIFEHSRYRFDNKAKQYSELTLTLR